MTIEQIDLDIERARNIEALYRMIVSIHWKRGRPSDNFFNNLAYNYMCGNKSEEFEKALDAYITTHKALVDSV